ncbi:hypothetical protein SCLCIDRAFT_140622 [Scleroderma citrinum Foug A]|uniref:HAT C-terminal dimerisation domain-containing protein n=1 Tax=Scleroderma citrinum Foug A TaxID=1036808 RepID=A0A0C3CVU5_9AGAM|nr:hypothetical protein SCLCIDRAFT_140622 [Scleroderma citrinum Foug A]
MLFHFLLLLLEFVRGTDSDSMSTNTSGTLEPDNDTLESDFDHHCRLLLTQSANSRAEGWVMELCRYLGDLPADVTKETNIIDWWVKHADIYPTLARIAKDMCGSEIATDRQSWLGADKFKHLQVLKHAWHFSISDHAATNSVTVKSIDILEQFKELLVHDGEMEHKLNASELVVTN